jgi:hypothetical protein
MASNTAHTTAPERDDDDDGKKSSRTRASDVVKTSADAAVELLSGVADAFGGAVRKAGKEIDKDDVTRFSFKNGLLHGVVEGTAHFLDKLPDVVRKTYDVLRSSEDEDEKPAKDRAAR